MSLRFESDSVPDPEAFLQDMAEDAYLEWYGKTLPRGDYSVMVALPPEHKKQYKEMMNRLVESGILGSFESYSMGWFRHRSLDENDYRFKRGRWNVNWDVLDEREIQTESSSTSRRSRWFPDSTDVAILGELQEDATQKLSYLSRKLGQTYRTIYYHYNEHVIEEGLVRDFVVFPDLSRKKNRRTGMLHFLKGIRSNNVPDAEALFERIPFTFLSGFGQEQGVYVAFTVLPIPEVTNMLEYISQNIAGFEENYSFELISLQHSQWYPVPHDMMDQEGHWIFDGEQAFQRLMTRAG
jgi:hypothetical protein